MLASGLEREGGGVGRILPVFSESASAVCVGCKDQLYTGQWYFVLYTST